ncbi:MAG: CarD family transcriptional regulator [bacterium]
MKLKKGTRVIYPIYGIGSIVGIEEKIIEEEKELYYVFQSDEKEIKIMIPIKQANNVGLRKLISFDEVDSVMKILEDNNTDGIEQNWMKRYKSNFAKLKTGSIFDTAVVVKFLFIQERKKTLSISEKNMFNNALSLLSMEISEVKKTTTEKIINQINRKLKKIKKKEN